MTLVGFLFMLLVVGMVMFWINRTPQVSPTMKMLIGGIALLAVIYIGLHFFHLWNWGPRW